MIVKMFLFFVFSLQRCVFLKNSIVEVCIQTSMGNGGNDKRGKVEAKERAAQADREKR